MGRVDAIALQQRRHRLELLACDRQQQRVEARVARGDALVEALERFLGGGVAGVRELLPLLVERRLAAVVFREIAHRRRGIDRAGIEEHGLNDVHLLRLRHGLECIRHELAIGGARRQRGKALRALLVREAHDTAHLLGRQQAQKICTLARHIGGGREAEHGNATLRRDRLHGLDLGRGERADQQTRASIECLTRGGGGTLGGAAGIPRQERHAAVRDVEERHLRGIQHALAEARVLSGERQQQPQHGLLARRQRHMSRGSCRRG